LAAQLVGQLPACRLVYIRDRDIRAGRDEQCCAGGAQARSAAGDQKCVIGKLHVFAGGSSVGRLLVFRKVIEDLIEIVGE
jgi:hypothetical protein